MVIFHGYVKYPDGIQYSYRTGFKGFIEQRFHWHHVVSGFTLLRITLLDSSFGKTPERPGFFPT